MTVLIPGTRYVKQGGTLTAVGAGGASQAPLDTLNSALAQAATQPVRIVFSGSSTTQGFNATAPANRYVNRLVAMMQAAYPSGAEEPPVVASTTATWGTISTIPGIHGYNAGEQGMAAATYLDAGEITRIGALNPPAIIHMIGANDWPSDVPPDTYKATLRSKLDALNAAITGRCVHVLIQSYERGDQTGRAYPWARYGQALRELAAADPQNVVAVDISQPYVIVGVPGADPANLLDTDLIHQTDAGHAFMAEVLRTTLRIPVIPTVAPIVSDDFTRADAATLGTTPVGAKTWTIWGGATFGISSNHAVVTAGGGSATVDVATSDYDVSLDITHGATASNLGITFALSDNNNRMAFYVDYAAASLNLVKLDAGSVVSLGGGGLAHPVVNGETHTMRVVKKGAVITCYRDGVQTHTHTLDAGEQTKYGAVSTVGIRHSAVGGYTDNLVVKPS